ncbi:DsbA family protein [Nonomuraea sp. JJY05]|uniref:DsbA family protein n=1 Tax=Nonomuraea sp. JJY05 TaxID=3350255 RepID=UPI00373DF5DD
MRLVYVFDAYCGWSHGFSRTLLEITERHPDIPVEVVSGGLFTGAGRVPISRFGYIQGANAKISTLTGAEFGEGYERLIADGAFVMDSEAAARGMAALRQTAPGRAAELAAALQNAFYIDGHSLSEPDTYRRVAEAAGLDADAVAADVEAPATRAAAEADFRRAAQLGVDAYPTLLAARRAGQDRHRAPGCRPLDRRSPARGGRPVRRRPRGLGARAAHPPLGAAPGQRGVRRRGAARRRSLPRQRADPGEDLGRGRRTPRDRRTGAADPLSPQAP